MYTGATLLCALKVTWAVSQAASGLLIRLARSAARILPQGKAQTPAGW
jgi:hypothetical protein